MAFGAVGFLAGKETACSTHDSRSSAGTTSSRRNSVHTTASSPAASRSSTAAPGSATETEDVLVEITGRLRHAADQGELPVVGDWVGIRDGQIDVVLPRRSKFSRKTPFTEVSEQVLVANVDVAFLVMGLDERDFSIRRLERYLTTAWEGGATPVIVLNKADLATDLDSAVAETESVAFGVPVHVATAVAAEGVDVLLPTSPARRPACCWAHPASASPR